MKAHTGHVQSEIRKETRRGSFTTCITNPKCVYSKAFDGFRYPIDDNSSRSNGSFNSGSGTCNVAPGI